MFKKLIANVSFSPALASQLGFYARRLRKEEATRRLGLIFTALALVVQSFIVFSPPEPANASSRSDFIPGGVNNLNEYLGHYDRNLNNIKDLYNQLGITRKELAETKLQSVNSKKDGVFSWGLTSRYSAAQGERVYTLYKQDGNSRDYYFRPLVLWDNLNNRQSSGTTYQMYVGYSKKFGWFALHKNCGNLITKKAPENPSPKYRCVNVIATPISRTKYRFEVRERTGDGAVFKNATFRFGDGNKKTAPKRTVEHDYGGAGSYVVSVKTRFIVAGSVTSDTSADCKVSVDVAQAPQPIAQCDSLSITRVGTIRTLRANSSSANGGKVTGYNYRITRDGSVVFDESFPSKNSTHETSFDASTPGDYQARLTVTTNLGDKTSADCAGSFTVAAPAKCAINPSLPANDPLCQPCPGDENLWIKDTKCAADVVYTKKARNITQANVDATSTIASASDRIVYVLSAKNDGNAPKEVSFVEQLADVSEYAQIIDEGGGAYSQQDQILAWPSIELQPGEEQARMFTVQLAAAIPATAQGSSDATSYDCRMINTYGNAIEIDVDCPGVKAVEGVITELPQTGSTVNLIFAGGILAVVTYFYARSRQLNTEIRLIRRDINSTTI